MDVAAGALGDVIRYLACFGALAACHHPTPPVPATSGTIADVDLARVWPDGCLATVAHGQIATSDRARCAQPRRPYSTFKLANALIALDAGVLADGDSPMTWDREAVPIDPDWPAGWTDPHTLATGLRDSAVPFFRTLALQLGETRMTAGLAKLDYGNRSLAGGLDKFWLSGGLRISALAQLAFVDQLAHGTLKVSAHAQEVVRAISVVRDDANGIVHGKTGSGHVEDDPDPTHWLVWQVGWIDHRGTLVPYAAWMESTGTWAGARAARDARLSTAFATLRF